MKILNLFYYGEENISHLEHSWAENSKDRNAEYESRFLELAEIDSKYTRAIKNLIEGLGQPVGEESSSIREVFDYISGIENWQDRIITTGLILRYSYAKTFGVMFYRVFYPVSPEFMRSFGKAFRNKSSDLERWDSEEAKRLIKNNLVDKAHVIELTREIVTRMLLPIEGNRKLAKELGLEEEVKLLSDISIAYPFQILSELGYDINIENEVKLVKSRISKSKS